MVALYHFCNFISILIFNFVNFIQKYILFLCTFTCFSLFCCFLAPFLTSFLCFFISDDLKYHFMIFMSWKFYGNLLQFCVALPVRFCRSPDRPGIISKIHQENSCHSPNMWVSAKIIQGQFQRTAPDFEISLYFPIFLHIHIGFFL